MATVTNDTKEVTHFINIENRDAVPTFLPSPREQFKVPHRIRRVQAVRTSPDAKYRELKRRNRQIDITSPELYVNGKKPIDGIFSPLFGADSTQDTPVYTCDCGELTGGSNKGRICPKCGTECRTIEADLRITGHIDIAPYHILTFHGYVAFSKVFRNLDEIITTTRRIARSGKVIKGDLPSIMDLYNDYEELYAGKIGLPKDVVFMSKIPVYSSRLRPLLREHMSVSILDVNKKYLSLVTLRNNLKSAAFIPSRSNSIEIQRTLNQMQQDFNAICDIVTGQINKKEGVFRHALASGRLDYSSRLVITLGSDLMAHEVDVPYQLMMVQYEEEIANYLVAMDDIPMAKAIAKIERHITKPHPTFVKIINILLRQGVGRWMLVNRNPTISETGIIYCRIRKIHDDFNDYTLHLPVDVLTGLGADFECGSLLKVIIGIVGSAMTRGNMVNAQQAVCAIFIAC